VALVFLLLMTMLATTAMRGTTMQERMAGNARDWNVAFQAAETALREAEDFLFQNDALPQFNDSAGFYSVNSPGRPVWHVENPSDGNGYVESDTLLPGVARQPRYFVEELSTVRPAGMETEAGTPPEEVFYFRITVVGYGGAVGGDGQPLTAVVLGSVFRNR
jgi:type IV pilus assembly protein PilX